MPKFAIGRLVATAGVHENEPFMEVISVVQRHMEGDWGELDASDKRMNDQAVKSGQDRILSKYTLASGNAVYVITEWDRSVTTVLYPSEY